MVSKVAIVEFDGNIQRSYNEALKLVGGIDDLNVANRNVVIKVGVFDPKGVNYSTVGTVRSIINNFNKAPKIYIAESDNYRGKALERLQIWKELFNERVVPFNLSNDAETKKVRVGGIEMNLSHVVFKPNVFVSTHILRNFDKGSIIKNLFGLVPDAKKASYHSVLDKMLPDLCEVIGGIDLAVLDATYFYKSMAVKPKIGVDPSSYRATMNTLVVSRDAVAAETVGAVLAGVKLEENKILQKAVRRKLGEGNLEKIEILGVPFEEAKEKFAAAAKQFKTKKKKQRKRKAS